MSVYDNLFDKLKPLSTWKEIDKKSYQTIGAIDLMEAKVVKSYQIGILYNKPNTVTIYDYGTDTSFIRELNESYQDLKTNLQDQQLYGIYPMYWETFGHGSLFSVIKLTNNPTVNIVDVFFIYQENVFCFHTFLPKEENNFRLAVLIKKYKDIKHIIKGIYELKNKL